MEEIQYVQTVQQVPVAWAWIPENDYCTVIYSDQRWPGEFVAVSEYRLFLWHERASRARVVRRFKTGALNVSRGAHGAGENYLVHICDLTSFDLAKESPGLHDVLAPLNRDGLTFRRALAHIKKRLGKRVLPPSSVPLPCQQMMKMERDLAMTRNTGAVSYFLSLTYFKLNSTTN